MTLGPHSFLDCGVASRLGRSEDFIKRNWNKTIDDCEMKFAVGRPDVSNEERYRELIKNPECVSEFLLFTPQRMMWITKSRGQSWDGEYFREIYEGLCHSIPARSTKCCGCWSVNFFE